MSEIRQRRTLCSYIGNQNEADAHNVKVGDVVSGFASSTGIHGLPNIHNSYGIGKKIYWIVLFLVMFGLTINNVVQNTLELLEWDVSVNINISTAEELPFPAVTVCNLNAYKLSALPAGVLQYLQNTSTLSDVQDSGPSFGSNTGLGTSLSSQLSAQEVLMEVVASYNASMRSSFGYSLDEFILSCTYSGYDCVDEANWKTIINGRYGNCYTFNVNQSMTTLTSQRAGPDYGLNLVLNTEISEYIPMVSDMAGTHVLVHGPYVMPFPENVGVYVAPGASTALGVRMRDISRLGGVYGDCYDTSTRDINVNVYEELYTFTNYTLMACQKTCFQKMIIGTCQCYSAAYPPSGTAFGNANVDVCSSFNQTQVQCVEQTSQVYLKGESCPQCIRQCNQTDFLLTISSAVWPTATYKQTLLDSLDQSLLTVQRLTNGTTSVSENLMQIKVYYEELNYEDISETASYTTAQFMSDLGGAVGLWIGASVLSVGELVELIADLIHILIVRTCRKKPPAKAVKVHSQTELKTHKPDIGP